MLIKEIMTKKVITVHRSTTLRELLNLFSKFHIFPLAPVLEKDGRLVGVVSFQNLVNAVRPHQWEMLKASPFWQDREDDIFSIDLSEEMSDLVIVGEIMEGKYFTLKEDTSLEEAYKLMKLNLKEEFPVVDNEGKLVGMVGIFDIVRGLFRQKGLMK